ncbi:hypothetical protein BESB_071410 [Besnoitia besnoiti]|uniref:SRS domain-containing protein n=1 Tax=Besnoitia besnoiti TaxID=94643 RepID=A0A2A9M7S5_BESBE|nr:uncharacterized protein BESB_071410 [Besnoitia besnoiti]PFH33989.1 hypothetical protein BESB_071410 [Besnoitia besnoiti]
MVADGFKMRGAVVVFAAICLLTGKGSFGSSRAEAGQDTCDSNKGAVKLSLPSTSKEITFKCGGGFSNLDPSLTQVYKDAAQPQAVDLKNVIPEARLTKNDNEGTYTLHSEPNKRSPGPTTLVYLCKKPSSAVNPGHARSSAADSPVSDEQCVVTITVAGPPKPEPPQSVTPPPVRPESPAPPSSVPDQQDNSSSKGVHMCTLGEATTLTVSKAPTELKLQCPEGHAFQPKDPSTVFEGTDSQCEKTQTLTSLVPDATLKPDAEDTVFTLTVSRLPSGSTPKNLCYRCEPLPAEGVQKDGSVAKRGCSFRIEVRSYEPAESGAVSLSGAGIRFLSIAGALIGAGTFRHMEGGILATTFARRSFTNKLLLF